MPIDYWDYLGWKDTLASPAHSARQRAYARVRGDRQVYTPQIVINGAAHVLGSDRAAIERAIAQTDQKSGVMSLPVLMSVGGGDLNVKIESAENEHAAGEVWLCPLAKAVPVEIGRGENRGRTIIYHNVVRGWVKLGDWAGTDRAGPSHCADRGRRHRCRRRHGAGRHARQARHHPRRGLYAAAITEVDSVRRT